MRGGWRAKEGARVERVKEGARTGPGARVCRGLCGCGIQQFPTCLNGREDGERGGLGLAAEHRGVERRGRAGGRAGDDDLGRHVRVDVTEVVDLRVRRVGRDRERHLEGLPTPRVLAVEEERLIPIETEAALVGRNRDAVDIVLERRARRLAAQLRALAWHALGVEALGVRAAGDVREADRVVPVARIRLDEGVRLAGRELQLRVDASAAGHLVRAPLGGVHVDLQEELIA